MRPIIIRKYTLKGWHTSDSSEGGFNNLNYFLHRRTLIAKPVKPDHTNSKQITTENSKQLNSLFCRKYV